MCLTSQLNIVLTRAFEVMNDESAYIRFENNTDAPCKLMGWPKVVGEYPSGTSIAFDSIPQVNQDVSYIPFLTPPGTQTIASPPTVVLTTRGSVAESVIVGTAPGFNFGNGPAKRLSSLEITPPGNAQSVTISATVTSYDFVLAEIPPYAGADTFVLPSSDLVQGNNSN